MSARASRRSMRHAASLEPQRTCRECGRALAAPITPGGIATRLREIIGRVPPRAFNAAETEQERRERTGEWDSAAAIHMRVTIGLLADDLDGICVFCSRVGREEV